MDKKMKTTVIYITDNCLDEKIDAVCKKNILDSIGGLPLISVSQKPIDFGNNICVGEMERSSLTINKQMMEALKIVKTKFIAIAEHDCLYTKEHFAFIPPDEKTFWYNEHVYMLQYSSLTNPQYNGLFSFFKKRKANSQLICGTDIMIQSTQDRIDMMSDPAWYKKYPSGRIGEAGAISYRHLMRLSAGRSVAHVREKLKSYWSKYVGKNWKTAVPNIDIRHDNNFTKNRRGTKRRYRLPYWGTIKDIFPDYDGTLPDQALRAYVKKKSYDHVNTAITYTGDPI